MKNQNKTLKCISIFTIVIVFFTLSSCNKEDTGSNLKYTPKNIYYKWTTSADCPFPSGYSLTYNHPDLPSSLTKNQQYGPMTAGSVEIIVNSSNGNSSTYNTLSSPPTGYKRIYTHNIFRFNSSVNRCNFYLNDQNSLTFVDQPM